MVLSLACLIMGGVIYLIFLLRSKHKKRIENELLPKDHTSEVCSLHIDRIPHKSDPLNDVSSDQIERVKDLLCNSKREISRDSFKVGDQIGIGNFGKVYKGTLSGLYGSDSEKTVAIKSISGKKVNEAELTNLLCEIEIMMDVPPHLNLVSMIASCASHFETLGELWLLLEFCQYGDLKNYLTENKEKILSGNAADPINSRCLIKWSYDIAKGMQFLSTKGIMHGDLAARNILMAQNIIGNEFPIATIADFGLSKKFNGYVIYEKKSREFVPWKWMALEYLTKNYFTLSSDVWSYGVLLWEILSFGRMPYGQQDYDELEEKIESGYRLTCPREAKSIDTWSPETLFKELSSICFISDPDDRGNFSDVVVIIEKQLTSEELTQYSKIKSEYDSKNKLCQTS